MKSPDEPLDVAAALLSSLAAEIPSVLSFRGRWSAVATAASRLLSSLSSLPFSPSPHPLLSSLLESLSQTLTLTLTLIPPSQSPHPPASKLHLQSDLSAAASALLRLADDADLLLSSGVLESPPPTSENGSVRAEARELVTRLQIGSTASRLAALDSLIRLIRDDDKNVVIAAGERAVPAIVRLLDSHETRERAVAAVARFSVVESCRGVLMAEGSAILNRLARVLESESGSVKEKACLALQTLTLERDNAILIGSSGGVAALIEICRSGTLSAAAAAAGVLKNLAGVQELRQNFIDENAIPILIRVLASGTLTARENSVACLCNLAAGEDGRTLKISIFKEGILDYLLNYWEGGEKDRNFESAIKLLQNLASLKYIQEIIQSSDLLVKIILSLDSSSSATRTEAAKAMAEFGTKSRKEIGNAVPKLVEMLEAKGSGEKEAAVKALASLVSFSGIRRLFRKEEKGIANVVMLLDPLVRNVEKKYPVAVLLSVSQSRRCRRQMVASGTCGFLMRLVEVEVEGAKRLLESLGRGKFWGVFPRN